MPRRAPAAPPSGSGAEAVSSSSGAGCGDAVLAVEPVRRRLASVLIDLAERHGRTSEHGTVIENVTHQMLASAAGAAREVVSRTLKVFEDEGLLRTGRARIWIRDVAKLELEAVARDI